VTLAELFRQAGVGRAPTWQEMSDFGFANSNGKLLWGCAEYVNFTGNQDDPSCSSPPPPPPPPTNLTAAFAFSPASPQAGQAVTFTDQSTGSPTILNWTFGDGFVGNGSPVSHSYGSAGTFTVGLEVSKPGCPDQLFGLCTAKITKTLVVAVSPPPAPPPPPPLEATIISSAECVAGLGFVQCTAGSGVVVQLTAFAPGATTFEWSFGDGGTGFGSQVSHTWTSPGSYDVLLTAGNGTTTATASRRFVISGTPAVGNTAVVLPWLAKTKGALTQSSDLYVHNPGSQPMEVTIELRKRGLPEPNPPKATRIIQPGATFYSADVLKELFNRDNLAGFIRVTAGGGTAPVINSFNTTFQADGKQFGQTVGGRGIPVGTLGAEEKTQHLVGLIDNGERLAYFGVTNPNDEPATYHLRFFDKTGRQIGDSDVDLIVSRFGQQQFQAKQLHDDFGVSDEDDFRIEIETKAGGHIVPYGSNLRLGSQDPSFIEAGASRAARVFLIGALSSPGLNNTVWRSDALLSNPSGEPVQVDLSFTPPGLNGNPTSPLHLTLAAGATERLENVISQGWGIANGVGVLTVLTTSAGALPIVQGESYENTNPAKRFGQTMMAVSEADAAVAGKKSLLVGLRQDAKNRTTFWLFNPGTATGDYDVVYRALDGHVVATTGVRLGGGKLRQFSPGQHPLPATGIANAFTVEVVVKAGKALAAAQVVNSLTGDPAYIRGEVR
jgi:PKD repeat protein